MTTFLIASACFAYGVWLLGSFIASHSYDEADEQAVGKRYKAQRESNGVKRS